MRFAVDFFILKKLLSFVLGEDGLELTERDINTLLKKSQRPSLEIIRNFVYNYLVLRKGMVMIYENKDKEA